MSSDKELHLDEDQLLWGVVDDGELPQPMREHLLRCPRCRAKKERFEQELVQLSQMAKHFVPSPRTRVSLPVEKPPGSIRWSWGWRGYAAALVTVVFMILVVWSSTLFRAKQGDNSDMLAQEIVEAEAFMTEVSMLVENALPLVYLDMTAESDLGLNEEFMEFVVPSIDDEPMSYDLGKRGAVLC